MAGFCLALRLNFRSTYLDYLDHHLKIHVLYLEGDRLGHLFG